MSSTLFDHESMERLRNAQAMRLELLHSVVGDSLPDANDLEKAKFVLAALRDVERVELDIAKVRAMQQQTDTAAANAGIMAQLVKTISGDRGRSLFHMVSDLPDALESDLIEGEADLEYLPITYDELSGSPD